MNDGIQLYARDFFFAHISILLFIFLCYRRRAIHFKDKNLWMNEYMIVEWNPILLMIVNGSTVSEKGDIEATKVDSIERSIIESYICDDCPWSNSSPF